MEMDGILAAMSRQASVHDAFFRCEGLGMLALWPTLSNSRMFDWSFRFIHPANVENHPQHKAK